MGLYRIIYHAINILWLTIEKKPNYFHEESKSISLQ